MLGDYAHNIRCGLDHLITYLVLANSGNPSSANQFPICDTAAAWRKSLERKQLDGVSASDVERVRQMQPFYTESSGSVRKAALSMLRRISNTDKHLMIHGSVVFLPSEGRQQVLRVEPPNALVEILWQLEPGTEIHPREPTTRFRVDPRGHVGQVHVDIELPIGLVFADVRGNKVSTDELPDLLLRARDVVGVWDVALPDLVPQLWSSRKETRRNPRAPSGG